MTPLGVVDAVSDAVIDVVSYAWHHIIYCYVCFVLASSTPRNRELALRHLTYAWDLNRVARYIAPGAHVLGA